MSLSIEVRWDEEVTKKLKIQKRWAHRSTQIIKLPEEQRQAHLTIEV